MKKTRLILAFFLISMRAIAGDVDTSVVYRFYDFNAFIAPCGSFQYSIFGVSTYGINNTMEIEAHPLMLFFSPSVDLKYKLTRFGDINISGISGFNYPTILMRLITKKGTGGFISPEFTIPQMISIRNGVVGTYRISEQHFISGRVLFEFAINNNALEPGTSIDLPLIAPHSAVYYNDAGFSFAIAGEGTVYSFISYHCKSELLIFPFISQEYKDEYPLGQQSFFVDFSGTAVWRLSETAIISTGFKLTYGDYPFGGQWHLLPTIDFKKWLD